MASGSPPPSPMSFTDFPEDVQLNILSFLSPAEISSFSCTSKRFASFCSATSQSDLWFFMCDRRWGSKTLIRTWADNARIPFSRLYKILHRWEDFIGFWRRIGHGNSGTLPLVFFEWGPSFITASKVSASTDAGSYGVLKIPFLWLGLSPCGEPVSFLYPFCRFSSLADPMNSAASGSGFSEADLVPVSVSFMGSYHFMVEENRSCYADVHGDELGTSEDVVGVESTSPPDLMMDIYQYFANRTSPGGSKDSRRQRKKKERSRLGRRWEAEHFTKIVNCYPTPERPLQGLWKGIRDDMCLDFYLVSYDDIGGISCRRDGDASPVFWTSNTTFLESPFSSEEVDIYDSRVHIRPLNTDPTNIEREVLSRILCVNSSYDLVLPDLSGASSGNPRNVEGRIWEYENGTFGLGFLRNDFIVDLKHIALNGCLLDTIEFSWNCSRS